VLSFIAANAREIIGRSDILALGTDINAFACQAASQTVHRSLSNENLPKESTKSRSNANFLGIINTDLASAISTASIDILVFNPPYVPAPLPDLSVHARFNSLVNPIDSSEAFKRDSHLLELSYAGGEDGMEITNELLDQVPFLLSPGRGVAYVLLCAQNKPEAVKRRISLWPGDWTSETVGHSGKQAGWEKLVILRITRIAQT